MGPDKKHAIETLAVHAGVDGHKFQPAIPPIYQTSTFAFRDAEHGAALFAGQDKGYIYSRMGNPTVEALETAVAALEGGCGGLACASGMAAIHTALGTLLKRGDHVVCTDAVYGPSLTLMTSIMPDWGVEATPVDTSDLAATRAAFRPNTKVLYIETPCNPTLVISDLAALTALAREFGAKVVVDNTFAGPMLQRPIEHGVDVVVHSLTKSLNGHADVVGGMIVTREPAMHATMRRMLNHFGGVLAPFDSFLVHRGLKTLPLRVERAGQNAQRIAEFLERRPEVRWVRYPGLRAHPQHALAARQMRGFGAVIAFDLKGGIEAGRRMMNAVRLCLLAVSLGGVETLICHPASMTHASMGAEARRRAMIDDGLVRLAVGIEHVDDLIADLTQALEASSVHGSALGVQDPERSSAASAAPVI